MTALFLTFQNVTFDVNDLVTNSHAFASVNYKSILAFRRIITKVLKKTMYHLKLPYFFCIVISHC